MFLCPWALPFHCRAAAAKQPLPAHQALWAQDPSPSVPFLRVWALPRLPLGLQGGAQPESRTPGKGRLQWPRTLTLTPRACLPLPCESLLPGKFEKGTKIKLG